MIRRWSHINNLNNFADNFLYFEKIFKINIFKISTNYKRFTFGITKFRRKSLIRIKHKANWLMYTVVIQLWIKDYNFNKHSSRYQFFNKILLKNFFLYNFNFIKNRNENIFYNFNFILSILSKKSYFYFYLNNFNYFKNNNITFLWFYKSFEFNNSIVPLYTELESNFYLINFNKSSLISSNFDFSIFFNFFNLLIFKKSMEIRKIFSLIFLYNTINF